MLVLTTYMTIAACGLCATQTLGLGMGLMGPSGIPLAIWVAERFYCEEDINTENNTTSFFEPIEQLLNHLRITELTLAFAGLHLARMCLPAWLQCT